MQIINNILKERFIKKSFKFGYRYKKLNYRKLRNENIYNLEDIVLAEEYNYGSSYNRWYIEIQRYNKDKLVCEILIYDYYLEWL